jgi:cytoskeletal protein CcmA (bactofilin family)
LCLGRIAPWVVLGSIHGNEEVSDRVEIRKEGRLVGEIRTARIVIEDGAYFKGSVDIVKPEHAKAPVAALLHCVPWLFRQPACSPSLSIAGD